MSILSVDQIQPIGSGTTVTLNATEVKTGTEITVGTGASIFSPAGNTLTLGTNNVERLRITNDGTFTVQTGGSERARITSAGNVGIGLDNPGEKLSVNGKIEARGGNWFISRSSDNSNYAYIKNPETSGSALGFFTSGEKVRITSAGNVGIGTDNPTEKFNVVGTNVKPVIGHKTNHTVLYSGYDSQNNTTLEISSSGTGVNVAGLNLDNPTTAANTSYKSLSFSCSGTSNAEKRGALITSNHAAASDSSIKANLTTYVNNGSALQAAMLINQYGLVTRPLQYHLHADRTGNLTGYNAGGGFGTPMIFNRVVSEDKDSTLSSCLNTSNGLFTAPVTGVYIFNAGAYTGSGTIFSQSWFTLNGSRCNGTDWVINSNYSFVQNTQVIRLAAGNTVGFKPYASGQSNVTIYENQNHTYFKVSLIG